jgi:hypothetical protein
LRTEENMSVIENGREARKFSVIRNNDESGVSGTGRILDGVIFHNGVTAICWRTDVEGAAHGWSSLGIYPNYLAFYFIHIKSHPTNGTVVVFEGEDGPEQYWKEINGSDVCEICEKKFVEHPRDRQWLQDGELYLRRICTGELVNIVEDDMRSATTRIRKSAARRRAMSKLTNGELEALGLERDEA